MTWRVFIWAQSASRRKPFLSGRTTMAQQAIAIQRRKPARKTHRHYFYRHLVSLFAFDFGRPTMVGTSVTTFTRRHVAEPGHRLAGFSGRYSGARYLCHVAGILSRQLSRHRRRGVVRQHDVHLGAVLYVILGQYLVSMLLRLVPIFGYDVGLVAVKFIVLPVLVGVVGGNGSSTRLYRTFFSRKLTKIMYAPHVLRVCRKFACAVPPITLKTP